MKKFLFASAGVILLMGIAQSQTKADFTFDTVCMGKPTTLTNTSIPVGPTHPILRTEWDFTHDTIFNDAFVPVVNQIFFGTLVWVGLKVVTDIDSDFVYKQVIIRENPTAYFFIANNIQCLGGNSFTFEAGSTIPSGTLTNFWRFGDGVTSALDTVTYTYPLAGSYTAWLIATSDLGCKDSIQEVLDVLNKPTAGFSMVDTVLCPGQNFQFINTSTIVPPAALSFSWTFGDGGTSGSPNPVHAYVANGYYDVWLVAISPANCRDSIKHTVHVKTTLTANFGINKPNQCLKGNNYVFTNSTPPCAAVDSIKWDLGSGKFIDASGNPITKKFVTPDTIMIGMKIWSGGAADSIYKQIIIYPQPIIGFTITPAVVQPLATNNFHFTDTSKISYGTLTTAWDFGDGGTSSFSPDSNHYSTAGIFNVQLISMSNAGCSDTLIKLVFVYAATSPNFIATNVCVGDSTSFLNTTTATVPVVSLDWALDNDSIFNDHHNDSAFNYLYPLRGTYSVGLKITTAVDTTVIYKPVDVWAKPVANFTVNLMAQPLATNKFKVADISTITPVEALTTFFDAGDGIGSTTNKVDSYTYAAAGFYNLKLVVTSTHNCKDSMTKVVDVYVGGVLFPQFTYDTVCFGDTTTLTSTTIHSDSILHYNWMIRTPADTLYDQYPDDSIVKTVLPYPGIDTVGLEVITATDTQRAVFIVTVYNRAVPDFTVVKDSQLVYNNLYQFNNTTTLTPPDTFASFWEYGDGGTTFATNPSYTYLTAGNMNVTLVVTTDKGCKDSISHLIYVVPVILNLNFTATNLCLGDTTKFTNTSTIQNDTLLMYVWDFGDGWGSTDTNPIHIYDTSGSYNVKLIALTKHGFKDSIIINITIHARAFKSVTSMNIISSGAYFNDVITSSYFINKDTIHPIMGDQDTVNGKTISFYETYKLKLRLAGIFDSLLWSTGSKDSIITIDKAGKYSIRVYDPFGCPYDTFVIIEILKRRPLNFYSAITPNGDAYNDLWVIPKLDQYTPCKLNIFNRWGQEVFSSSDYKNNWDGYYEGNRLPQGTYYFILETKDGTVYKGAVNLLR